MTAQRRRDPRAHHEHGIMEDVEVVAGGQIARWAGVAPADMVIIAAHQAELDRIRPMWGLDMDAWLLPAEELLDTHPDLAAVVAREWCDTAVRCAPHDDRAPDYFGFEVLAKALHKLGRHDDERAAVEEWLTHWPADRETGRPSDRRNALKRLERKCA